MKPTYSMGTYLDAMETRDLIREADPGERYSPESVTSLAVRTFPAEMSFEADESLSPA